jgi:hypothetical protein
MPTRYYLACAHEQFRPDELLPRLREPAASRQRA